MFLSSYFLLSFPSLFVDICVAVYPLIFILLSSFIFFPFVFHLCCNCFSFIHFIIIFPFHFSLSIPCPSLHCLPLMPSLSFTGIVYCFPLFFSLLSLFPFPFYPAFVLVYLLLICFCVFLYLSRLRFSFFFFFLFTFLSFLLLSCAYTFSFHPSHFILFSPLHIVFNLHSFCFLRLFSSFYILFTSHLYCLCLVFFLDNFLSSSFSPLPGIGFALFLIQFPFILC